MLSILSTAVSSLYDKDKHRVLGILSDLAERSSADNRLQSDSIF